MTHYNDDLERFRSYLLVLARQQLDPRLRSKADESDLVQDAMIRLYGARDRLGNLDAEQRFSYARKVLKNVMITNHRFHTREKRAIDREKSLQRAIDESSLKLEQILQGEGTSPSDAVMRNERKLLICEALQELPDDQRTVIEMFHLAGRTIAEIAEQLGKSPASVAGLLRRGVANLNSRLKELDDGSSK